MKTFMITVQGDDCDKELTTTHSANYELRSTLVLQLCVCIMEMRDKQFSVTVTPR